MKCLSHPDSDAVGICKHCNAGLCLNCAVQTSHGLACAAKCEEEVVKVGKLIDKNIIEAEKIGGVVSANRFQSRLTGFFYVFMGLFIFGWGLFGEMNSLAIFGAAFTLFGIVSLVRAIKTPLYYQKDDTDST